MIEIRRQAETRATNGARGEDGAGEALPGRSRNSLRRWTAPAIAISVVPVVLFGLVYLVEQFGYVTTDNAQITGTVAQVGHVSAGQVRTVVAEVGDEVGRNQLLATVFSSGQLFSIRSPFDGVVVARYANPGDALTAGRAVLAVLDPADLWVEARVEEWQAGRVRPGQAAEVTIDALGQTVRGQVVSVGSASVGSLAAQPAGQAFAAGRPRQLVPVRIEIDHELLYLVYGGLASVKIHIR